MSHAHRPPPGEPLTLAIREIRRGPAAEGYEPVTLVTSRGEVRLRHYPAPSARSGTIFVGGVGGDWDSPAHGQLYPELCTRLAAEGFRALRVRFRHPTLLQEAVLDILAGLRFLLDQGAESHAVTGHAFGAAAALQAAARSHSVRVVVALATQAFGAEAAAALPDGCATLFLHGTDDEVLPPDGSRFAHRLAPEPKRLRIFDGASHDLAEVADEVDREIHDWLTGHLPGPG